MRPWLQLILAGSSQLPTRADLATTKKGLIAKSIASIPPRATLAALLWTACSTSTRHMRGSQPARTSSVSCHTVRVASGCTAAVRQRACSAPGTSTTV